MRCKWNIRPQGKKSSQPVYSNISAFPLINCQHTTHGKNNLVQSDYNYVFELIDEFFADDHIQKRFSIINSFDISGWEIWFQIEFSHFLATHLSRPEWYREFPIEYDKRKEKNKSFFKPDFIIRKKGWKIDTYTAIEIKQHPSVASCIKNMIKDIEKVSKMKSSQLDMRTLWVLGIFKANKEDDLDELVNEYVDDDYATYLTTDFIGDTGFAYVMF